MVRDGDGRCNSEIYLSRFLVSVFGMCSLISWRTGQTFMKERYTELAYTNIINRTFYQSRSIYEMIGKTVDGEWENVIGWQSSNRGIHQFAMASYKKVPMTQLMFLSDLQSDTMEYGKPHNLLMGDRLLTKKTLNKRYRRNKIKKTDSYIWVAIPNERSIKKTSGLEIYPFLDNPEIGNWTISVFLSSTSSYFGPAIKIGFVKEADAVMFTGLLQNEKS